MSGSANKQNTRYQQNKFDLLCLQFLQFFVLFFSNIKFKKFCSVQYYTHSLVVPEQQFDICRLS